MGRDIATRKGALPLEKWLHDLREHVGLVRRAVPARAEAATPGSREQP